MGFWIFKSKKIKPLEYFEIEKEEKNESLGLKVHICGDGSRKNKVIEQLFNTKKITDKNYLKRGKIELKTEQFYWIAITYNDISKKTIDLIMEDIKRDRDEYKPPILQQVILCFITEKNKENLSCFDEIRDGIYTPLIIIVSENKIEKFKNIDCRKITNIIYKNINDDETLNRRIISALWENDCYYNEKGNKLCRYTPDNIFKALEVNLSFYSINILLTGKSRAGKSTFINYLSNKLVALESNAKESVTKELTEYYLYINNEKEKSEKTAIKLLDTPGIVQGNLENSKKVLKEYLKKRGKNMEKQIHFILFFFMEGGSLEGIEEILEILNNCELPVLFIINKAFDDSDNGKTKDIQATISFLKNKKFNNLINEENFIGINIVKTKKISTFGVEEIFKRIYHIYKENNKFTKEVKNKIKEFVKEYHSKISKIETGIEELNEEEIKNKIDGIKKEIDKDIFMFKYLNIESIIESGVNPAIRCKNVINSFSDISKKIENLGNNIPIISFLQAFMVKEIGEIFGYDTKEMNYGIKIYFSEIKKMLDKEGNLLSNNEDNKDIKDIEDIKDIKEIKMDINIIENQIKSEFEKSNKEFILSLAELFSNIRKTLPNEGLSEDDINRKFTNQICLSCINYLREQLLKTNGLIFWMHYLKICEKLLEDLKNLSEMDPEKDWGKKEIIIKYN